MLGIPATASHAIQKCIRVLYEVEDVMPDHQTLILGIHILADLRPVHDAVRQQVCFPLPAGLHFCLDILRVLVLYRCRVHFTTNVHVQV